MIFFFYAPPLASLRRRYSFGVAMEAGGRGVRIEAAE